MTTTEINYKGTDYTCRIVTSNEGESLIIGGLELLDALMPYPITDKCKAKADPRGCRTARWSLWHSRIGSWLGFSQTNRGCSRWVLRQVRCRAASNHSRMYSRRFLHRHAPLPKQKDDNYNYYKAGDIAAGFSKEYRGCANGYYYALIDDEHFIGIDIDWVINSTLQSLWRAWLVVIVIVLLLDLNP